MKKRLLATCMIIVLVLIMGLVGCNPSNGKEPANSNGPEQSNNGDLSSKQVTLVLKNNVNPFWVRVEEGAKDGAKELGIDLTVLAPMVNDSNEEQSQLVEQAIINKSEVIIIAPADSRGIIPAAKKVHDAGIPLVDLNSIIAGDEVFWETFVGLDNVDIGRQTMRELCERIGGEGDIIILEGVAGTESSYGRIDGANEILEEYPNVNVVSQQAADWSRAKALTVIQNLLPAHPDLKAIYCVNDEMAMGSVEALEMADRLDSVLVTGIDANEDAREAIKEGRLTFSLDTNPWAQGYDSVKAAKDLLEGKEVDPIIVTAVKIIDIDNIDE